MDLEAQKRYEAAYQAAVEIIKQEWFDAGTTQEEWDESQRVADAIDTLAGAGYKIVFVPETSEAEGTCETIQLQELTPTK